MVDSWAAHGRGWVTFECSHLHDYLQLALMLRHPDHQIPHAAQKDRTYFEFGAVERL